MLLFQRAVCKNHIGQKAYVASGGYSLASPIIQIVQMFGFENDLWTHFLLFSKDYSAAAAFSSF